VRLTFHVNADDRITYVDAGWAQDAFQGGAPALAHAVTGASVYLHVQVRCASNSPNA